MNIQLPPPPRDQPKFNVNLPILSFSLEELNHVCMTLNPTWVVFVFTLIYIILIEIKFLFYINLIVVLRIEIVKESNFPISSSSRRLQPILYITVNALTIPTTLPHHHTLPWHTASRHQLRRMNWNDSSASCSPLTGLMATPPPSPFLGPLCANNRYGGQDNWTGANWEPSPTESDKLDPDLSERTKRFD